jgi:uncharacterized protein
VQQAAAQEERAAQAQAQRAAEAQRAAQAQQAAAAQRTAEAQRAAQGQRQADAQKAAESAERTARAAAATTARTRPSFDCSKARSTNEKLICGDEELASLDRELGRLYSRAKERADDRRAFQQDSDRQWQQRESNCQDRECLRRWYAQRRAQLEPQATAAPSAERRSPAATAPVAAATRTPRPRNDARDATPSEPMAAADSTTPMVETPRATREARAGTDPAPRVIMRPAGRDGDDAPVRQPRVIVIEPSSELAPSDAGASQ